MAKNQNQIAKYLGLGALALAVVYPLLSLFGVSAWSWVSWILLSAGIIVGFTMKSADVKLFLAGLVVLAIAGMTALFPAVGATVNGIFTNLTYLVGGILVLPALRIILTKWGIKF